MTSSARVLYHSQEFPLRNNFLSSNFCSSGGNRVVLPISKGLEISSMNDRIDFSTTIRVSFKENSSLRDYKWLSSSRSSTDDMLAVLLDRELLVYEVNEACTLLHTIPFEGKFVPCRLVVIPCAVPTIIALSSNLEPVRVTLSPRSGNPIRVEPLLNLGDYANNPRYQLGVVSEYGPLYLASNSGPAALCVVNPTDKTTRLVSVPLREGSGTSPNPASLACYDFYCIACHSATAASNHGGFVGGSAPIVQSSSLLSSVLSSTPGSIGAAAGFKHALPGTSILEALSVDSGVSDREVIENAIHRKKVNSSVLIREAQAVASVSPVLGDASASKGVLSSLMNLDVDSIAGSSRPVESGPKTTAVAAEGGSFSLNFLEATGDSGSTYEWRRLASVPLQDAQLVNPDVCALHPVSRGVGLLAVGSSASSRVVLFAVHFFADRGSTKVRYPFASKLSELSLPEKHTCRGMQFISAPAGSSSSSAPSLLVMAAQRIKATASLTSLSTSSPHSYQLLSFDTPSIDQPPMAAAVTTKPSRSTAPVEPAVNGGAANDPILAAILALRQSMEGRLDAIDARLDSQEKSIESLRSTVERLSK